MIRRGPVFAVSATFIVVVSIFALAFLLYAAPQAIFGLLGKDETFTGRTNIWSAVLHQIIQRPLTGYGFGAVWDDPSRWGAAGADL